jgi:thioredoxin reductase
MTPGIAALETLARRARDELALFDYPDRAWVTPVRDGNGDRVHNVLVAGGGQNGLGIAFALRRERIDGVTVLDENPPGQEGPWATYARMLTLRTLKFLTGPDLGVAALTFRAWHEAQYGEQSWNDLIRIPREEWMRYLIWFRATLNLPVRNGVRLDRIEPRGDLLAVHLTTPDGPEVAVTRKLVLASGMQGAGRPRVPEFVRENLPKEYWAHTTESIDFAHLASKRIAVIGAGASAFDNAATALEAGAAGVDLFFRRPELPTANPYRALESRGFFRNFGDLSDDDRWRFMRRLLAMPMPPPVDTVGGANGASRKFSFACRIAHPGRGILRWRHSAQDTGGMARDRFSDSRYGRGCRTGGAAGVFRDRPVRRALGRSLQATGFRSGSGSHAIPLYRAAFRTVGETPGNDARAAACAFVQHRRRGQHWDRGRRIERHAVGDSAAHCRAVTRLLSSRSGQHFCRVRRVQRARCLGERQNEAVSNAPGSYRWKAAVQKSSNSVPRAWEPQ